MLDYRYKKSVETCRAHRITGIGKRHRRNELRNKYPTLLYIPWGAAWAVLVWIYKQNERCIVLIPLRNFADFVIRDKARNAFLIQGFLPSDAAKLVFYFFKFNTNTPLFLTTMQTLE